MQSVEPGLIKALTPRQGPAFDVGTITVLLGGSHVGKSELLRDIARLAARYDATEPDLLTNESTTRILADVQLANKLTIEQLVRGLSSLGGGEAEGRVVQGLRPDLKTPHRCTLGGDLRSVLFRPTITARAVSMTSLGELMPLRVGLWEPRMIEWLVAGTEARGPVDLATHPLQELAYASPETLLELDRSFSTAFPGQHLVFDDTQRVRLALRIADQPPVRASDPIAAVQQYSRLASLEQAADGMRCLAAVLLSVLACPNRVWLLDQPDLYLQPAQARVLGRWLADQGMSGGGQFFIVPRSTALVEGLFQASAETQLCVLTRRNNTTTVRPIPRETGQSLARFPLVAAQDGLGLLQQRRVILVTDDEQRILFETVARRILGRFDVGFLQTHGSSNLHLLAKLFRSAGMPTSVVTEFDLFQEEAVFVEFVTALTGEAPANDWLQTRARLAVQVEGTLSQPASPTVSSDLDTFLDRLKQPAPAPVLANTASEGARDPVTLARVAAWNRFKDQGLASVPPDLRLAVDELLEDLKLCGLFVSTRGRSQGWLAGSTETGSPTPTGAFNRILRALHGGQCPPEVRNFVADLVSFELGTGPPRATRRSHST